MKVLTIEPVDFAAGDIQTPDDLNALYLYAKDALDDAASRRFAKSILVLPYCEAGAVPYTQAMNVEELTYRFICPFTCVVERGALHANMTSDDDVRWNITKASDGTTPDGCTTPWLSTNGAVASAADDTTDLNVDRFVLAAGVEYQITVSAASGNFSLTRADVILHLATDRWVPADSDIAPSFDPTLFTDASARDASVVVAQNTSLTTEAQKLANNVGAPMPIFFVAHGILSGTSANLRTFRVPRVDPARAQMTLKRMYLWVYSAVVGDIVTAELKDAGGAVVALCSVDVSVDTEGSDDAGALALSLENAAGDPAAPAHDYTLVITNSDAVNPATKAYVLLWVARG